MERIRWYNYLLGGVLGLLLTILLTRLVWPIVKQLIYRNDSILYFIGINLTFIPIVVSILLVIKFYHKSNIKFLINTTGTINYKRVFIGFSIWFLMQTATLLFSLIFDKDSITYNFQPWKLLTFLLLSLILTPIQVASEEFLFRGYLINWLKSIKKGTLFPLLISGILFALPHLNNPEVKNSKGLFFFIYLVMALLFGYLTLKYKGLEYSFGVHFANNFFAINLLNYPDSPLPSSPLFLMNVQVAPLPTLIQTLLFSSLLVIIIKKIENNSYQKQKK